jgi:ligand-binding sensor domain-containing protein
MNTGNNIPTIYVIFTAFVLLLTTCNPEEDVVYPSDLGDWTYFKKSDGLPSNTIYSLYEDKSGKIWIGTDAGLSVYDGSDFTNFSTNDGLVGNSVYAVLEDKGGKIWAGSTEGLNVYIDGQWFYFPDFYGVEVNAFLELSSGDILIGTGAYGVYRYNYDINLISAFDVSNTCAACNSILALYKDSEENIWVGSFAGARRIKNNTIFTFNTGNGLSGNIVTYLVEDSYGNVWAGCFNASTVSRLNGNSAEKIQFTNGNAESLTFALERDTFGHIWIGAAVFGLYRYDGAVMNRVYDEPPGNTIRALLSDKDGNLWVGSSTGLGRYVVGVN